MTDLDAAARAKALITEIVNAVAELPDRSSPDDWPEAMLVTMDELEAILADALIPPAQAAIAAHEGQRGKVTPEEIARFEAAAERSVPLSLKELDARLRAPPAPEAGLPGREEIAAKIVNPYVDQHIETCRAQSDWKHYLVIADAILSLAGKTREWMPIDTAPKDGTYVLLVIPYDEPSVTVGAYDGVHPREHWHSWRFDGDDGPCDIQPTHWLPLPSPPTDAGKG